MKKIILTNYEKLLFTIIENAVFKTVSAIKLHSTKYAYNQAYFLTVIAEEELRSEERRVGKECRSRWSPYH